MSLRYSLFGCLLLWCWGCQNIEDAKPSERNSFVHVYEAAHDIYGVTADATATGYIILCNETLRNGGQNSIIIQTDSKGNKVAPDVILPNGTSNCLKVTSDGYYIIGDSIKTNPSSSVVADLFVVSARLFKLDLTGNIVKKLVIADRTDTANITDFHGGAVTIGTQGELVVLGTFKKGVQTEKPYLAALNAQTLDTIWYKDYDIIDRDYVNSKAVHITPSGRILWISALLKDNQNFSRSYLGVPYIKENSIFENFSEFGELTDQRLYAHDIQPATSSAFGFGVVGTYSSPDVSAKDGNLFFVRVDQYGGIITGSDRYFDGEEIGGSNQAVPAGQSSSDDTGDAVIGTSDGGFILGGSMETTANRGNGGTDVLLIKVDAQGNVLWNKIYGGIGDETVNSIRETADGGFLICGSNNLSGLSSVFIMKTDKNGELKN